MEWKTIRATYERVFSAAKQQRMTQESVAERGGLPNQNAISKLLRNDKYGPTVEVFVRAVEGTGMKVSDFFVLVEQRSDQATTQLPPIAREDARIESAVRSFIHALRLIHGDRRRSRRGRRKP